MKSISQARVLLAHSDERQLSDLATILDSIDHMVVGKTSLASELLEIGSKREADIVMTCLQLEDGPSLPVLLKLAEEDPLPAVVVTQRSDIAAVEKALEDHVMAYLVEPVTADELRPTIHLVLRRFAEFEALKQENDDLRSALEARKVVEQAKGVLMKRLGYHEDEAYRWLQKRAAAQRTKLREVAQAILLSGDLIQPTASDESPSATSQPSSSSSDEQATT